MSFVVKSKLVTVLSLFLEVVIVLIDLVVAVVDV